MRIATTIAEVGKKWVTLDVGPNVQEQKETVKKLMAEFGPGPVRVLTLYSGGQYNTRKSIAIKGDVVKAWEAAKTGKPAKATKEEK